MKKSRSARGACVSKRCKQSDEFDRQLNSLRYKPDGTLKSTMEIREEMNQLRRKIGIPTKSMDSKSSKSSKSSKKVLRATTKSSRRSERIREKNARRSQRIKNQKNRATMGGRKTMKHRRR